MGSFLGLVIEIQNAFFKVHLPSIRQNHFFFFPCFHGELLLKDYLNCISV